MLHPGSASAPTITRLRTVAAVAPDTPALGDVGGAWTTHAQLVDDVGRAAGGLRAHGVVAGERVAIVTGGGPSAVTTFLAASWAGTAAPLNPRLGPSDLDFALGDLAPRLLLATTDAPATVVDAAARAGIPVLDPTGGGDRPGQLDLGDHEPPPPPASDAVALVLHTSGTTGRPKQVPLTHANLTASSTAVVDTLGLTPDDRCLGIMPLFHIHGLVATVLATLRAGGSLACAPAFSAPQVLGWLRDTGATWYSAVPTMHQGILDRAAREGVDGIDLRLIRSSSASLAPSVLHDLEATFDCPVAEAYGMTEAAHQITSNPLPPGERRPGTVGLPAGPAVRVLRPDDTDAAVDEPGAVVIRGRGVTAGYLTGDPAGEAFVDGWLRTGDQGRLDADGYLTLTGRMKELINRAGESIAPREIDEVLLTDPSVAQAVAFALPDDRLGEAVAAAVVPAPGHDPDAGHLRRLVAAHLAAFKVPERIVVVDAIPMGPTGKLQRVGLAAALGLDTDEGGSAGPVAHRAPSSPVEEQLAALWADVLDVERVGVDDHFLDLGGDSLLATRLLNRVRDSLGDVPDVLAFYDAATVAEQAGVVVPR